MTGSPGFYPDMRQRRMRQRYGDEVGMKTKSDNKRRRAGKGVSGPSIEEFQIHIDNFVTEPGAGSEGQKMLTCHLDMRISHNDFV